MPDLLNPWVAACGALVAAVVVLWAVPWVIAAAERWGAVDLPDERKLHTQPMPRWGGLAIAAGLVSGVSLQLVILGRWPVANLPLIAVAGGGLMVLLLGAVDDRWRLRAAPKLVVQTAAAVIAWLAGVRFEALSVPFREPMALDVLALPLTLWWIVLVTNAWNLIDGLDGLAASLATVAVAIFAVMLIVRHMDGPLVVAAPMLGALVAFLPYNLPPARIFLGDSGSYLLGYVLAVLSIHAGQKGITGIAVFGPLAVLGLPVLDTLVAVVRRLARAEPLTIAERLRGIFRADRGHLHHRALARGWSARKTVVLLSLASMVLGLWGLLVTFSVAPRIGGVVALIVLLALLLLYGINAPPAPQDPVE